MSVLPGRFFCRPCGTWFLAFCLPRAYAPGLHSVAALRLGFGGSFCALCPWVRASPSGAEARFKMMGFGAGLKACSTLRHQRQRRRCGPSWFPPFGRLRAGSFAKDAKDGAPTFVAAHAQSKSRPRRRSQSKSTSTAKAAGELPASTLAVFPASLRDLVPSFFWLPRACALGCILSPLCGWGLVGRSARFPREAVHVPPVLKPGSERRPFDAGLKACSTPPTSTSRAHASGTRGSHLSQKTRKMGHPLSMGVRSRSKSTSKATDGSVRSTRATSKAGAAGVRGSHLSQKTRKMGHPLLWWRMLSQDPGRG